MSFNTWLCSSSSKRRSETSFEENDSCGGNDQKDLGRSEHTKTSYNQVGHVELVRGGAKALTKLLRYSFHTSYHQAIWLYDKIIHYNPLFCSWRTNTNPLIFDFSKIRGLGVFFLFLATEEGFNYFWILISRKIKHYVMKKHLYDQVLKVCPSNFEIVLVLFRFLNNIEYLMHCYFIFVYVF